MALVPLGRRHHRSFICFQVRFLSVIELVHTETYHFRLLGHDLSFIVVFCVFSNIAHDLYDKVIQQLFSLTHAITMSSYGDDAILVLVCVTATNDINQSHCGQHGKVAIRLDIIKAIPMWYTMVAATLVTIHTLITSGSPTH